MEESYTLLDFFFNYFLSKWYFTEKTFYVNSG